ncbi:MAG: ATP-dependent Clp protease ATP-binding subunit ClpX [Lachnospiraceae bacterium]|nr:ATP-dependent Clp protease ATP-binding subunit ClpX [Lachnospiraceae bacterium]
MASDRNDEYEEVCMMCHRPESRAGRMIHLPGDMCICGDCMDRSMRTVTELEKQGVFQNPEFQRQMRIMEEQLRRQNKGSNNSSAQQNKDSNASSTQQNNGSDTSSVQQNPAPGEEIAKTTGESNQESSETGALISTDVEETKEPDTGEEEKKENIHPLDNIPMGFPQIRFVNLSDLRGPASNRERPKKKKKVEPLNLKDVPAPHKIKAQLDEYVIGQEHAKKVMSVAVYNHYKRVATGTQDSIEIEKSNMLMIGPTGCGKTYLVKTLAKLLDVPLAIADATSLTEAGYIGDDIESVVTKLLAAADNDVERAERGIIFIDEIDKIAKKQETRSRDVSGESVQQGMLKLLEGSEVEVPVGANSKNAMVPLTTVNTRNILFICGGAFPDLEDIIRERLTKNSGIGFGASLKDAYKDEPDLLSKVTTEDLRKFGMIPEFLGRLPVVFTLQGLDKESMVKILKEPKNAILKQYQKLLELDEVELTFDDDALEAIAEKAMERDIGARALRSIIEDFMLDIMYEIPKDDNIGRVRITRAYVEGKGGPVIEIRGQQRIGTAGA